MEVDLAWLEADPAAVEPTAPKRKTTRPPPRRPPTLRNAAARRETLEVAPEWLQVEGGAEAPAQQGATAPKRARPPWQPPTLPPPPETAARKPTRTRAASIPREEPDAEPITPEPRKPRR